MTAVDCVARVVDALNRVGIPYMAVGSTAEDVVVTKLRWSRQGRRQKDVDDVRNVLAVQSGKLDLDYIRQWADQHGTRPLLEQLLSESPT